MWAVSRIAGTGFLLPTAAAATLVLTATGVHLGTNTVDLGSNSGAAAPAPAPAPAPAQPILADRREPQELKSNALRAQSRLVQDRAARDSERQRLDAVAQEDARRAAEEQSRQVNPPIQQVAPVPPAPAPPVAANAPVASDDQAWTSPVGSDVALTSGFGMRWGALHPGQDFAVSVGTPVKAMSSGTVILAGWSGGYGNKVEIRYWDGTVSWYAHISGLKVRTGQAVSSGQVVALSGNTGHSTGPHLHLEIHPGGADPVPPVGWLKARGIMP